MNKTYITLLFCSLIFTQTYAGEQECKGAPKTEREIRRTKAIANLALRIDTSIHQKRMALWKQGKLGEKKPEFRKL